MIELCRTIVLHTPLLKLENVLVFSKANLTALCATKCKSMGRQSISWTYSFWVYYLVRLVLFPGLFGPAGDRRLDHRNGA